MWPSWKRAVTERLRTAKGAGNYKYQFCWNILEHSILMTSMFLIGCYLRAKIQNPATVNQRHCADLWNDSGLVSHGSLARKAINSTSLFI